MQAIKRAVQFAKLNPVAFKAWAVKWCAIVGVVLALCLTSYLQGKWHTDDKWEAKIAKQESALLERRSDNAVDAGKRLGHYSKTDAQLEAAVADAKQMVHDYYAKNPTERLVEKTKLVPVPGKEEYVYVPIGACPNDFLNDDELRIWNFGNQREDFYPSNPK